MNFSAIALSIVVSLFILWIWYRIRNRELFKMIAGMNDLNALPLIGLAHLFIGKSRKDYFKIIIDLLTDDSMRTPVQFWICSKLCIVVDNAEDIQTILTSPDCYEKGSCYDQAPFANGLITAKPQIWLNHRKMLNSVFHIKLLKGYIKDFNEMSKKIVLNFELLCGKGGFNMSQMIGNHVVDVQLRTFFGIVESSDVISRLCSNVLAVTQYIGEVALQLNCHPIMSVLHHLARLLIENRFLLILNENYDLVNELLVTDMARKSTDSFTPEIFVKRLAVLHEQGLLGDSDLYDHVTTMLLAGIDTMIITINNIFMLLAMNPVAQEKCYSELVDTLGLDFQEVDVDQLNKLRFLDCTIKECLRLIPTVPLIQRKSAVDISICGGTIPKGVDICIPVLRLHLKREYWGDQPNLFNPDNFLEENISKRPSMAYIPYSYGSRNCIAAKYANWTIRVMVAHLIAKYKFTTKMKFDELKFEYGITMAINPDQLIEVVKR